VRVEQQFSSPTLLDPTASARRDAARIVALANTKRVLFAHLDHELWEYVFKALHNIMHELRQALENLLVSEPQVSKTVTIMVRSIAEYLSVHETDYSLFMRQPTRLYAPHRERDWSGMGEAAQNLLSLRHLLNQAIQNLEAFATDGTVSAWKPPTEFTTEHWLEYSKRRKLCEVCARNLGYMPKELCARCSEHNAGFYLEPAKMKWPTEVYVAGSFNDWKPDEFLMKPFSREYEEFLGIRLSLPEGKHLYKFIVDGEWMLDTRNKLVETDRRGNLNSVLVVFPWSGRSWFNRIEGPEIVF
jgi:Glycogen recognition site of AMP-activated protein kinase